MNLTDRTIIVFFSDNGFLLGEHGQWQKEMLFEEAARVPLIIVPAGGLRRPKTDESQWKCNRVVELLDVYPTLVEMAGLKPPRQKLEGRSLGPLLRNPQAAWDHPALSQTPRRMKGKDIMGYSIRTERWRYTEWGSDGEHGRELYDHSADPREFKNLAASSAGPHQAAARQLKQQLERLRAVSKSSAGEAND
ncbi:MAG: sulfatase-like hydrolase/transferase [Opitutaceae bacterium]|nr:sulfatase-like hydrolase/transferase [Opitutaceae bacterium]